MTVLEAALAWFSALCLLAAWENVKMSRAAIMAEERWKAKATEAAWFGVISLLFALLAGLAG